MGAVNDDTGLWFAFKLGSSDLWYQLINSLVRNTHRCDLLSNWVLPIFDTNKRGKGYIEFGVVICFQTGFFRSLIPTRYYYFFACQGLWFAFKLGSSDLWYQHVLCVGVWAGRCDLLSNWVLPIFDTNTEAIHHSPLDVVICFQTGFFRSLIPTKG